MAASQPMIWENVLVYLIRAVAALFPLVNPFGVVPLFMALTADLPKAERARIAGRACVVAASLMIVIMIIGEVFMQILGVSLPAVRVAVGLIIAYMGFGMLFARFPSEIPTPDQVQRSEHFAFIPLGFPGLSGAGALSITIGFSTYLGTLPTLEEKVVGHTVATSAIIGVCLISWLIMIVAGRFSLKRSRHGWEALGRAMGILKVCIGIQFVANGVGGFIDAAKAAS